MDNNFWEPIMAWFEGNARDYPWRNTTDPFHILIAEILLQQTNVRLVPDTYTSVVNKYPTPIILSAAEELTLIQEIKHLGLKYRAGRLIHIAEDLCRKYNSIVPNSKTELLNLVGVGDYISDAVLCYAYAKPTVAIDTNVFRLFLRYFGFNSDCSRARTDKVLRSKIREQYCFKATRKPNLAVLDYASVICTAKKPACELCNLRFTCRYYTEKSK